MIARGKGAFVSEKKSRFRFYLFYEVAWYSEISMHVQVLCFFKLSGTDSQLRRNERQGTEIPSFH